MNKCFLYILTSFLFLSGCATQKLSVADKEPLKAIRINPIIKISHPLYYYTGRSNIDIAVDSALKGVAAADKTIGKYIVPHNDSYEPNNEDEANKLKIFLDKNNVAIDKIVFDVLNSNLQKYGKIPVTEIANQANATLYIEIFDHGFYILSDFSDTSSSTVVPLLSVWCVLIDSNGKKIWAAHHNIEEIGNPVKAVPLKEFSENAVTIENLWRNAAKIAADNILVELYL